MNKLRLIVTDRCENKCPKCVNRQYDIDNLPVFDPANSPKFDQFIITGGEPLINKIELFQVMIDIMEPFIKEHKRNPDIILYSSAKKDFLLAYSEFIHLGFITGMTYTIRSKSSLNELKALCYCEANIKKENRKSKSTLIIKTFPEIEAVYSIRNELDLLECETGFAVHFRRNTQWLDPCPMPENEVLMRMDTYY